MGLFELIFHIKKGMYCSKCEHEITYEEMMQGYDEFVKSRVDEIIGQIKSEVKQEDV